MVGSTLLKNLLLQSLLTHLKNWIVLNLYTTAQKIYEIVTGMVLIDLRQFRSCTLPAFKIENYLNFKNFDAHVMTILRSLHTCCAWALSLKGRLDSHNVLLVFAYKMSRVLRHIMIKLNKWFTPSPNRTLLQKPCFISQEFNPTVIIILVIFVAKCDMWNGGWHKCSVNLWDILASQNSYIIDITIP